jgi:hypothetical protein
MSEMMPAGPAGGAPPPEQPRPNDKGKPGAGAPDLGHEAVNAFNDLAGSRDSSQPSGGGDWFGFTDGQGNWNTGEDASGPGSGGERPPVKPDPGDNAGSPPGDQGGQGNIPRDSSSDGQDWRDESEDGSTQGQEDDAGKPPDTDQQNDTDHAPQPETPGHEAADLNSAPHSAMKDEDDQKMPGQPSSGKPENSGEEPERKKEKSPSEKDKAAPGREQEEKTDAPEDKKETGEGASEKEGKDKGEEGQPAGEPGGKAPGQPGQKNAWLWKNVGKRPPGSAVSRASALPKGSGAASSHANPAPSSQSPLRQFQQESAARRAKFDAVVAWNEHAMKRAEAQDVAMEQKLRQLGQAAIKKK